MSFWKMTLLILFVVIVPVILTKYLGTVTKIVSQPTPSSTSQPTPSTLASINKIKVKYPQDLTMVLVGDSMTEKLGNSDEIRADLKKYYPTKTVEVLNYGFGSTNILSVTDRLTKETDHFRIFRPILDIDFDMILIESFGHNPLSELPLEDGLKAQTQALDKIVQLIKTSNPKAKIIFVATIAPNRENYGRGQVDLSPAKRKEWADERTSYIKNHIAYAQSHNIPLINIFEKSLDATGDGKLDYIDTKDYIHPSPGGVIFISQEIADFIFNNHLF